MLAVNIKIIEHREAKQVAIFYKYASQSALDRLVRSLPNRSYSSSKKCWYIPYREDYKHYLSAYFAPIKDLELVFDQQVSRLLEKKSDEQSSRIKVLMRIDREHKKIYIEHPKGSPLYSLLKNTHKGFWIQDKQCWVFNGKNDNYVGLLKLIKSAGFKVNIINNFTLKLPPTPVQLPEEKKMTSLKPKEQSLLNTYSDTITLKRLSNNTRKVYVSFFSLFLNDHTGKDIENLTYNEIYTYIKHQAKVLEQNQLSQSISAIKFFYERVMDREKMFFSLQKPIDIRRGPVYIPLCELQENCSQVSLSTDQLLLFLVFHLQMSYHDIGQLSAECKDDFVQTWRNHGQDKESMDYFQQLYDAIQTTHHPQNYLFEVRGQGYNTGELRQKVYGILHRYRLKEIYKKQYGYILDGTDYSPKTKAMYLGAFIKFLEYHHFRHPTHIRNEEIRDYMVLHREKSSSHQDNMVNAFKFFFEKVHKSELSERYVIRPRKGFFLPDFFTNDEFARLLYVTQNIKHRLLLSIFYSSGMRREEVRNLKIIDIDLNENRIFIRSAKGNKDRYSLFSEHLHQLLATYLAKEKPKLYLFEGVTPGMRYSTSSMASVLKRSAKAAGIQRRVHIHMLRHSFATHLLEDGWDIRYIQELMGHRSIKTTTRYTQIVNDALQNVKSPFDKIHHQLMNRIESDHAPP